MRRSGNGDSNIEIGTSKSQLDQKWQWIYWKVVIREQNWQLGKGLFCIFLDIVAELHDLVRIYMIFSFLQARSNGTNQRSLAQTVYELEASKDNTLLIEHMKNDLSVYSKCYKRINIDF